MVCVLRGAPVLCYNKSSSIGIEQELTVSWILLEQLKDYSDGKGNIKIQVCCITEETDLGRSATTYGTTLNTRFNVNRHCQEINFKPHLIHDDLGRLKKSMGQSWLLWIQTVSISGNIFS